MIWRIATAVLLTLCLAVIGLQAPSRAQFNGCAAGFCSKSATAAVATTFDSTKAGTGIGLSPDKLTATYTGSSATNAVWANVSHSTGKFYFELNTNIGSSNAREVGIGNGSAGTTGYQVGINDANSIGWGGAGTVFSNNVTIANISTYGGSNPIAIAVDLGGALIWFKDSVSGNYNNSGAANPATGVGGIALTITGAPFFPMVSLFASGDVITANFGATAYTFTPPAGFGNW